MEFTMQAWLYGMVCSGGIGAILLYLCPCGYGKSLLSLGLTCVMLFSFISPLMGMEHIFDLPEYRLIMEHVCLQNQSNLSRSSALEKEIIQREYEAYLLSEAKAQGISIEAIQVETEACDGAWIPYEIIYYADGEIPQSFVDFVRENIGVESERQYIYGFSSTEE